MEDRNCITLPMEWFCECMDAIATVKAIKALIESRNYISSSEVAKICGLELKKEEE